MRSDNMQATQTSEYQDKRTLAQIKKDVELTQQARDQAVQASLARLLASENIHVEFRKTRTASFNVRSRVLIIPVFAPDLKAETVSMLVEHEVGHALYTPQEGWHGTLDKRGPGFKSYLNVMEDVRIERLVKAKFPGTRKDFYLGYQDLIKQNFFGSLANARHFQLIDKINIYCKAGPTVANFAFTPDEMALLERAQKANTWDEVVDTALAVCKFDLAQQQAEDEKFSKMFPNGNRGNQDSSDYDDDDDYDPDADEADLDDLDEPRAPSQDKKDDNDLSDMDEDDETEMGEESPSGDVVLDPEEEDEKNSTKGETAVENPDTPTADGLDDEEPTEEEDPESENQSEGSQGPVTPSDQDIDAIPVPDDDRPSAKALKALRASKSDEMFRDKEASLFDANARDVVYIDIANPPPVNSVVVDYKRVQAVLVANYVQEAQYANRNLSKPAIMDNLDEAVNKAVKAFRKRHEAYITNLVRVFELKKNASQFARASESKTGQLNLNKMHQYKFNDDLFRKVINIPKGKNHGVLMYVDFSGSMSKIIRPVMEQAAVMAAFCRRINVPFRVCTFTDGSSTGKRLFEVGEMPFQPKSNTTFKYDSDLFMPEFFNDKMTMQEFNRAIYFTATAPGFRYLNGRFQMGGTPLDQCILQLPGIVSKFRAETGAEKITAIYLTDGGSTDSFFPQYVQKDPTAGNAYENTEYFSPEKHILMFRNSWNKKALAVEPTKRDSYYGTDQKSYTSYSYTQAILRTVREVTGCNLLGYFIVSGHGAASMIRDYQQYTSKTEEQLRNEFRDQYFMSFEDYGYNEYFCIWDKALSGQAGAAEQQVSDMDAKTNKGLASAFTKMKTDAARNRVFVTKFMSLVAG